MSPSLPLDLDFLQGRSYSVRLVQSKGREGTKVTAYVQFQSETPSLLFSDDYGVIDHTFDKIFEPIELYTGYHRYSTLFADHRSYCARH